MILICPGIHHPALTDKFFACLNRVVFQKIRDYNYIDVLILPADGILPLSGLHIIEFLHQNLKTKQESPVVFISFSAGVVGAITAAHLWQLQGGRVKAFIAIDGWGVPLFGNFPIHRISHDYFTHWSSLLLGGTSKSFYADPPVEHLQIWENPQVVQGWLVDDYQSKQRLSATEFLHELLGCYLI
ncbi:MAG: hypothetical protein IGS39_07840 [Calothrix sp. C42_A2020_038]|nr:hypothetical protein [Calothrix sp. C42_A2020_038]